MKLKQLKFSDNYDKLRYRKVGKSFTTFRGYVPSKEVYYREQTGRSLEILLGGEPLGTAKLLIVSTVWCSDLKEVEVKADTFLNWTCEDFCNLMKRFYRNEDPFLLRLDLVWEEVI